ncbi:hypothetical protein B9Z65_6481 [Elsinoe australis]|uniref:Uncharacterized protein n=1 Tax=Elsinoe australis TaxID=40998 RepID=A0A2P8A8S0_9PEZI|nr:hypothetical protein B9Z65_6481 [Elsinoe australis]
MAESEPRNGVNGNSVRPPLRILNSNTSLPQAEHLPGTQPIRKRTSPGPLNGNTSLLQAGAGQSHGPEQSPAATTPVSTTGHSEVTVILNGFLSSIEDGDLRQQLKTFIQRRRKTVVRPIHSNDIDLTLEDRLLEVAATITSSDDDTFTSHVADLVDDDPAHDPLTRDASMDVDTSSHTSIGESQILTLLDQATSDFGTFIAQPRDSFPSWNSTVDDLWSQFLDQMELQFGKVRSGYCKPSGNPETAMLQVVWHYPTISSTQIPHFGWTRDPSNGCMKALARRLGLDSSVHGLCDSIFMIEHCFERFDFDGQEGGPYVDLPVEEFEAHLDLKRKLYQLYKGPVTLLMGETSANWHKAEYPDSTVVVTSHLTVLGERAHFRIERDESNNVRQLVFISYHMHAFWLSNDALRGQLFDEIYKVVAAISLGRLLPNPGYFAWFAVNLKMRKSTGSYSPAWHWVLRHRHYEKETDTVVQPSIWPSNVHAYIEKQGLTFDPAHPDKTPLCQLIGSHNRKFVQPALTAKGLTYSEMAKRAIASIEASGRTMSDIARLATPNPAKVTATLAEHGLTRRDTGLMAVASIEKSGRTMSDLGRAAVTSIRASGRTMAQIGELGHQAVLDSGRTMAEIGKLGSLQMIANGHSHAEIGMKGWFALQEKLKSTGQTMKDIAAKSHATTVARYGHGVYAERGHRGYAAAAAAGKPISVTGPQKRRQNRQEKEASLPSPERKRRNMDSDRMAERNAARKAGLPILNQALPENRPADSRVTLRMAAADAGLTPEELEKKNAVREQRRKWSRKHKAKLREAKETAEKAAAEKNDTGEAEHDE